MGRTLLLGGLAAWVVAANWLRLEDGESGWQAVLVVVLALVPLAFAAYALDTPCVNAERLTATLVTVPSHEGVGPPYLDRIRAALRG